MRDHDGTNWRTVRYTVEIDVIADTPKEALYFAALALPDYSLENYTGEVLPEPGDE